MEPIVSRVPLATNLTYEVLEWMPDDPACDRTLLLLHGYLDLAWGWLPIVESGLFGDYHVIAPSFRGFGGSDWVGESGAYFFLDYVDDLASLIEQRARGRLSVVGHSMGGTVAAYLAGTFPDRVERLALLEGISVPDGPAGPERMRDAISGRIAARARRGTPEQPGSKRFASLAAASARMQIYDPKLDTALALRIAGHGCVELPSGEWVFRHDPLHAPRSPYGFEVQIAERFWREVRADLLYVEGADSLFRLSETERTRRLGAFTNARSRTELVIPDAGHMMIRHRADETARALAGFLAGD